MVSRLLRVMTLVSSPFLSVASRLAHWWRQGISPGYFLVSADYPGFLQRGEAASFCLYHARRYCVGVGVDIGAGRFPFPGARAIENRPEENAYHILEADQSLDYVFSSHCLEHLAHWRAALHEWQRVIKPGGILYLYLPHPACRMWSPTVLRKHHVWQPEPDLLAADIAAMDFEIIENSLFPDSYLSFYVVARRRISHNSDSAHNDDIGSANGVPTA